MIALLAAKVTVWEKLQAVPKETWISLLVAGGVIFMTVKLWKSLKEINDIVPWIVIVTVGGAVILYWTYERTEPKVLSPIFDELAKILPSKIQYKEAPNL
jgi:thiamine biosynthesis protein ThiC